MLPHRTPIVGIAGLPRSGKDTVAKIFIDAGFFPVSLGEIVRDLSRQRHADQPDPISVAHMTETANHYRTRLGSDFALQKALALYKDIAPKNSTGLLIISVRAQVEADYILSHNGRLIWVEADDRVRYERNSAHLRAGEKPDISLEAFLQQESLQWRPKPGIPEEAQMNVSYVKKHATDIIDNSYETLQQLHEEAIHKFVNILDS